MSDSLNYEGLKWHNNTFQKVDDELPVEDVIQININGEPYTILMRTPGDELELVQGLLYTEDIYRSETAISFSSVEKGELGHINEVHLEIPDKELGKGYLNSRSILSVSSCGICGKRELGDLHLDGEQLDDTRVIHPDAILKMYQTFETAQENFRKTGGSHAAATFGINGDLITLKEDVGRHNAVDKVVGSLIRENRMREAACILVSGRISYEIVTKVFMAKIPILAAVSAPSTLAIDFAKELGITLFGFCREDRATCYAHAQRVKRD